MSFEKQAKRDKEVTQEISRQGKCGSCGKYWEVADIIDGELSRQINKGMLMHSVEKVHIIKEFINQAKS
jgi:hypothetical protein